MTQDISSLKEEIQSKDQQIVQEESEQKKQADKNKQLENDKEKIKRNIISSEQMIKT